jgi:fucose 4-O-acetylase-like acetyltransferase
MMVTPSAMRRDGGLDALRAAMTLLVVFHHAALTYGAIGGWYYREVPTDGRIATKLLILFCTVNQAWFMGLFFLIAGYLTPGAAQRHGGFGYLRERLRRLGIPLLIYIVLIGPMTIALARTARGQPFLPTLLRMWELRVFDNGPLWFAQALLIFAGGFLVWRAVAPGSVSTVRAFPSTQTMIPAALITGLTAFDLRLVWRVGETVYGLQLAYFASYIVLFAVGCAGAAARWLEAIPDRARRLWLIVAMCALPVMPAVVLLAPEIPALRGDSSGGWNIQAAVYAFWEPPIAWGFLLALLQGFARRFRTLGPVWSKLSRRAFAIYIIHPPILVAVALAWREVAAPQLVKFAITGSAACLVCYGVAGLLLRAAWIRRIV